MYPNICRKHLLERYVWCLREVVCINLLNWWYTCVAHSGVKYENELAFGGNDEFHAFLQFLDLHEKLTEKEDMSWLLCNIIPEIFSPDNFSHLRWINKEASLSLALCSGDYLQWLKFCDAELHGWLAFLLGGNLEEIQRESKPSLHRKGEK